MNKRKIALASLAMILVLAVALYVLEPAFSPGNKGKKISGRGVIRSVGIGLYTDSSLSAVLSSVNWGTLESSTNKNSSGYVQNEGNSPVVLSLSTANWNPSSAAQFISVGWDYNGTQIAPSQGIAVTFTLSVSESISGITDFNFVTVIGSSSA